MGGRCGRGRERGGSRRAHRRVEQGGVNRRQANQSRALGTENFRLGQNAKVRQSDPPSPCLGMPHSIPNPRTVAVSQAESPLRQKTQELELSDGVAAVAQSQQRDDALQSPQVTA